MGTFELAIVGLAGSGVGLSLGLPMLWASARAGSVRLMGGWLVGVSAVVALISGRLTGLVPAGPAAEHGINVIGLTVYPLLYLYMRRQTRPAAVAGPTWWLWSPALVYTMAIPIRAALGGSTRVPFAWLLPVLLSFTAACASLVARRERRERRDDLLPAEWIVGFLVILNVAQIVRMLFGRVAPVPALVPLVLTAGFAAMVGLVAWRAAGPRPSSDPRVAEASPRYARSGLDDEAARDVWSRIERAFGQDRLFADPGLTLRRLAAAAGSTPHHVSQALNRHAGLTFHDLVSRYRVADVKTQLADPSADRFTIEGIGATAGFRSRSALYAAFRKLEGMTPAEYRSRARA